MLIFRRIRWFSLFATAICCCGLAQALTVHVDYSTDVSGFFSAGTQARASMEAAASFYSGILNDTLSPIQTPPVYQGLNGRATFLWQLQYTHPVSEISTFVDNPTIPADQYRVYVGARDLPAGNLGLAGPGGRFVEVPIVEGSLTGGEWNQVSLIQNQLIGTVNNRGEASGFVNWGGVLTVDSNTAWHFDSTTPPTAGTSDLYSVLLHELGHVLGIGTSLEWTSHVNGSAFDGEAAVERYGSVVPLSPDKNHWQNGIASKVLGGTANQEMAFDPSLTQGTRKRITEVDAAALVDIGWEIDLPQPVPGDYNSDGFVDAADYSIWRDTLGSTSDLRANGDNSGTSANKIDQADYTFWKLNFGNAARGGGSLAVGVPEPAGITLFTLGGMLLIIPELRRIRLRS